jgi:creatinine amidohydrolase
VYAPFNDKSILIKFNLPALVLAAVAMVPGLTEAATAPPSVYLEELTTTEVAAAIREGKTTIIIPVGGTEQNGPHMVLGKHNIRAKALAGKVALQLGNALVAPVVAYVPEGNINPPTEHMRFAGTISVPEAAFKTVLDAAGRGFKQHGFQNIVLVGDSGNYQGALKAVAAGLNRDWAQTPARAHFVAEYYRATQTTYIQGLKAKGLTDGQIGLHAGSADTSLLMALDPSMIRNDQLAVAAHEGTATGTRGDPRASTAALGQIGVDAVVSQTVAAIRSAVAAPR